MDAFIEALCADFGRAGKLLARQPELLALTNPMGETALHFLAVENHPEEVRWLAEHGADLNTRNAFLGDTPLTDAAKLGHLEMVELLLDLGADPCACDNRGHTALHHAASQGRTEVVELLSEAVPELVNFNGADGTPLHAALVAGKLEAMRILLAHRADPELVNRLGETPLMKLSVDSLEAVMDLQHHGARLDAADNLGRSVLHHAAQHGLAEVIRYYMGQGLHADYRDLEGNTPRDLCLRMWPNRPRGEDGWPLEWQPPQPAELAALSQRVRPHMEALLAEQED